MPLPMYKAPEPSEIRHTVAIAAGKGGVGKSTLTVNIALALRYLGYRVGIIDCDIYGPSIRKMLPEEELPKKREGMIVPAVSHGIRTISTAYFQQYGEAVAVRAPIANRIITGFMNNILWGSLDFLLLDFPPGTGDIHLSLAQRTALSGAVMVTTPQEIALIDVARSAHLFTQLDIPIIGVVENMSSYQSGNHILYPFGQGGGKKLAKEIGTPLLAEIPLSEEISRCGDLGMPIIDKEKEVTEGGKHFLAIASQLIEKLSLDEVATKEILENFTLVWREM